MVELREHERKTLSTLSRLGGKASVEQLTESTGLTSAAVMRGAMVLQERKLVKASESKQAVARLTEEGRMHARNGLPERRLIIALSKLGGKAPLKETVETANLEHQFIPIALGWIQRKNWATFDNKTKTLQIAEKLEEGIDEKLLKSLAERPLPVEELSPRCQESVQILKGRKLLETEEKKDRYIEITDDGKTMAKKGWKTSPEVTQLTPELIISGKWRKARLQRYDVEAPVSSTWPGKRHPYLAFLDEVKEKLVNLGFKEMVGTQVETSFYNFDALYTPQDHPAREIFDVYFVKRPKYGRLNAEKKVLQRVKKTHEDGWKTGSAGWRYKYSMQEAKRLILRGHGTCLSARTLLSKDLEIPGKYFSIARCYRPEVSDKTHLTEFNQVEGIVIDEGLNLSDLLGVLEKFAKEIASAEKIRLRPDYYPFTEPSVELSAYKKEHGWVEFGGSGIFRPEVTMPLGIRVPVIAWGLGIDRLFMMKAGVDDIRYLFAQDLAWIRRKKAF